MKEIDGEHLFSEYPQLINLDELKAADILIMPRYHKAFSNDQNILRELSSESNTICLFFSEDQNSLECYITNATPIDYVYQLGTLISTISGLTQILEFFEKRMAKRKFRVKNVIRIEDGRYYEMTEFEGTIDDYRALVKEAESLPRFRME